jgi:DNA-binding MarR family transcriptional regulator
VSSNPIGTVPPDPIGDVEHPVRDQVDVIIDHWHEQNPELDIPAKALSIRLRRVTHHLQREVRRELAEHGIELWEFEMLLALRRAPGHQLSAGGLLRQSQVTSGAITNRLSRLEDNGWIRRDVDPQDRRQVLVTLTKTGLRRAQKILDTKIGTEERLFGGVDPAIIERLTGDLRTLLVSIEGPGDDFEPEPGAAAHFVPEPPPKPRTRRSRA